MTWLRSGAAVVIGYAVMIGGAWLGQESIFAGSNYGSPFFELAIVGLLTAAGAGLGGAVTALLAPRRPFLHLLPMAALISIETIALYVTGRVQGPLWFEMLAGASLIAGTFAGAWLALEAKPRLVSGWGASSAA